MLSETLVAQSPHSPYRRAPSTLANKGPSNLTRGASRATIDQDIEGLLTVARGDIQRLKDKDSSGKVTHAPPYNYS